MTITGQFVGSLPWAAPEQVEGDSHDIDTRTDVYALGVILYQLLTRRFPYPVVGRMRVVMDHIRESPPANPRAHGRQIDDELATLVLKCLAKERERRYQTAGELARDLRRYLADEPIEAKRDSGWYVVRKTLRRHRRGVFVAAGFMLLVTAAAIALSILYARQGRLLVDVEEQRDMAEYESFVANIAAAGAAIEVKDGGAALARLQTVPAELRNWEWHYLARQADQSVTTWYGPKELITGQVQLSPDGHFVGASFWMENRDGAMRVWRRSSSETVGEIAFSDEHIAYFQFLGEGGQLLLCFADCISRFNLAEGRETSRTSVGAALLGQWPYGTSPDGRFLLTLKGRVCRLWDTGAVQRLHDLPLPEGTSVSVSTASFDASAGRLVTALTDGTLVLWDVTGWRALARSMNRIGYPFGVAFSPNGRILAISGEAGRIELWELVEDASDMRMIREMRSGDQRVSVISFSPDGRLLAAPSADKAVWIWNVHDGTLQTTLLGHTTAVACTAFSSDGRFVVSGAREGEVKLWDLEKSPAVRAFRELPDQLASIAFTADGAKLLLQCGITACVVDFASGRWLHQRPLSASPILGGMLPGPSGSEATFSDPDGSIRIWETGSGESRIIGAHKSIPRLAGDRSGRVLASADEEAIVLWDWAEGRESRRFVGPGEAVRSLALSHDAARLAIGLKTGELIICDARTGERTAVERAHSGSVGSAAFSPNGRNLATGSDDGTVKLWDVAIGRVKWSASPHLGDVWCVAFSPDGTRLAAGGRDRTVRIFDPQTGRELLALRGPTGTVMCVAFSPDGRSIAAGSWAREVFIWDASPTTAPEP